VGIAKEKSFTEQKEYLLHWTNLGIHGVALGYLPSPWSSGIIEIAENLRKNLGAQ
jgi:hypothetical protein